MPSDVQFLRFPLSFRACGGGISTFFEFIIIINYHIMLDKWYLYNHSTVNRYFVPPKPQQP